LEQPKTENTAAPTIADRDVYEFGINTRNFEISMFWQRSNYFLALNTALAVGYFTTKEWSSVGLALFGYFTSLMWFRVCLGSKFWQARWEQRLAKLEKKLAPDLEFFAADWSLVYADVESSLKGSGHTGKVQAWIDRGVMKKHSVSYNMTLLALAFCIAWGLATVIQLWLLWLR
jgi:hypothetical protein